MNDVADRLESLMHLRHRSQSWLGDAVGMTQSSISKVLRGEQRLYLDQAILIARALEVPIGELVGEESTSAHEKTPDVSMILKIVETLGIDESLRRLTLARPPLTIEVPPR